MSDSETRCSDESTTCCESPELDIGNIDMPNVINDRVDNDADFETISALNELDSMLEYPASQPFVSGLSGADREDAPSRGVKVTKSRSINEVLNRLPAGKPTAQSIYTKMDMQDIRLLLNACGAKASGSNLTKASAVQQSIVFIENGELLQLKSQLAQPVSNHQFSRQTSSDARFQLASNNTNAPLLSKQKAPVSSGMGISSKEGAVAVQWLVAEDSQQWQPVSGGTGTVCAARTSFSHILLPIISQENC